MGTDDIHAPRRRDSARTRRALLEAAATAVATSGSGVSVDVIAKLAGVSKSGLLHHFGSKEELFAALAEDAYERFDREVDARTDEADLAPGRRLRGYLRAMFPDDASVDASSETAPDYWSVEALLSVVPGVAEQIRHDAAYWDAKLTADGFDPRAMRLIRLAATGAEIASGVGVLSPDEVRTLREELIELSRHPEELTRLVSPSS